MTILHVYREDDALLARYVAMLTEAVGSQAVMHTAAGGKELKRRLAACRPDIVHLHGLPPASLPAGVRLVFTPHGEMASGLPAYVVVARSKMEAARLAPLYPRIEMVLNPLITRTTNAELCAHQMMAIYQQVMDSGVLQLMNADTRQALSLLLAAAIGGDSRWVDSRPLAASLPHVNFRLLYIYAMYEGVLPFVQQGIRILGIQAPQQEPTQSYLPATWQLPVPMEGASVSDMLTDIREHGPSLLRLVELALALRDDSLDEAQLLRSLEDSAMQPLLAATLQLMHEQQLLTEGFMPCPPEDNREAQELRRKLCDRQDVMAK